MTVKVITESALLRALFPNTNVKNGGIYSKKQIDDAEGWHEFIDSIAEDYLEGTHFYIKDGKYLQWRSRLGAACEMNLGNATGAVANEIIDMIYPRISTLLIWKDD